MTRETLTVAEAAQIIGIHEDTLYTMVRQKQIPHVRCRRRILFRKETILLWMAQQEQANVSA